MFVVMIYYSKLLTTTTTDGWKEDGWMDIKVKDIFIVI
jgi:hypothetical protein